MNVSSSTKEYFDQINERTTEYYNALEYAKNYIITQTTMQKEGLAECLLMSILWVASTRGEQLTEQDVCVFLNVEKDLTIAPDSNEATVIESVPAMAGQTLDSVLEFISKIYGVE